MTAAASERHPRLYQCPDCSHELRVFGSGRHRVYFEPEDARFVDPVMDRACPACGRLLAVGRMSSR